MLNAAQQQLGLPYPFASLAGANAGDLSILVKWNSLSTVDTVIPTTYLLAVF